MKLFILTAPIQTGKTTWLKNMIRQAEEKGFVITGLFSPAIFENGTKTGIDIELLPSHKRFGFATKAHWDGTEPKPDGKKRFGWNFSQDAFDKANRHFDALDGQYGDLFVVDEFGGVELFQGGGYTSGLAIMDAKAPKTAMLLLRPDLVPIAQERWGEAEVISPELPIEEFLEKLA